MSKEHQNNMENEIEQEIPEQANENVAETSTTNEDVSAIDIETKYNQDMAAWKDKYTRLLAEFDNFKKRSFKEKMETIQVASREVMQSMTDVLDDCDRAEKTINDNADVAIIKDGVLLVFNKFRKTLEAKGLKSFDSIGNSFDVELHEAVTEINAGPESAGKVVDELQKGYYLNDKLIRHAKVVVGKSEE